MMTIRQIKQQLSIEQVLSHYGLVADRNGMLSCPFHDDKTPSLQIYPKTNSYCCFSTNCNAGTGDQLQLIELMEVKLGRVSGDSKAVKHHAIELAKNLLGYRGESLLEVFSRLRSGLRRSKNAKAYAKSRNIDIENCEVGYNGGSYEELKSCLVFPLKDELGQIVSLYGRSIIEGSQYRHFYQRGRRGLYPGYPKKETQVLVLTEGVIDAWSLLTYGELENDWSVLALYGAKVLAKDQELAIRSLEKLEEIVLFFDGDGAGQQGVEKWNKYLSGLFGDLRISQVDVPDGEDVNSLVQGHELGILGHLLSQRKLVDESKLIDARVPIEQPKKQKVESKTTGRLDASNPSLLVYEHGPLLFSLIGGVSGNNLERLRVTLKAERRGLNSRLRHSFDLYNDDQLERYARKAADRLDLGSEVVRSALYALVDAVESYRMDQVNVVKGTVKVELSVERRNKAIAYLESPYLLKRTNEDIEKTGVVGERINRLLMYLCFTSRLRSNPLHVVTLGGSGTGKTYLQEKISALMPEEDIIQCTASTDNAFYYIKNGDLRHKLVLIEDLDGAEGVMYILRELMSKQMVSKLLAMKDASGKMETVRVEVHGPISLAATTTRERLYEDNANRSILLYPDGSVAQQERIMEQQRRLSAGLIHEQEQKEIRDLLKDVQRVLRPIQVRNPYAEQLRIPLSCFKPLRTNAHYLHFIEAVTFYHQYQREVKTCEISKEDYIETSLSDIEMANALLKEVLLRKSDELSVACRRFYTRLLKWLKAESKESFYSREVRSDLRMHPSKLKRYLRELLSYGYAEQVGGSRYRGFEYKLLSEGQYQSLKDGVEDALSWALESLKKTLAQKQLSKS